MHGMRVVGRWALLGMIAVAAVGLVVGMTRAEVLPLGKAAPELATGAWINSEPLTIHGLRGRVVLVDFWTYG